MANVKPGTFRRFLNAAPAMWSTGVQVSHISDDWCTWDLVLRRRLRNLNYVGTLFGGSIYAAADPHFMLALLHILGPDYIVWDKAATIRFIRPGKTRLFGRIDITPEQVDEIKAAVEKAPSVDRTFCFVWKDPEGRTIAEIEKVLYFRKKDRAPSGTA